MRSPILGTCLGADRERLKQLVRVSTRITHTDPKAECGALAVAWAAHRAAKTRTATPPDPAAFAAEVRELLGTEPASAELLKSLDTAVPCLNAGNTTEEFARTLGLARGATGYMYHTVPVALYAWLRYPDDYRTAVQSAIRCGGDTDTVAAVAGSLVGARVGKTSIPAEWLRGIIDWPRSVGWIEALASHIAEVAWQTAPQRPHPLAVWALPARNAVFFAWVLVHAARRLLPPY